MRQWCVRNPMTRSYLLGLLNGAVLASTVLLLAQRLLS